MIENLKTIQHEDSRFIIEDGEYARKQGDGEFLKRGTRVKV